MKLRDYLLKSNITQETFASLVGISRCYMNSIIRGKRIPGKHLAIMISRMTNNIVRAEPLLEGTGGYDGARARCERLMSLSSEDVLEMNNAMLASNKNKNGSIRQ